MPHIETDGIFQFEEWPRLDKVQNAVSDFFEEHMCLPFTENEIVAMTGQPHNNTSMALEKMIKQEELIQIMGIYYLRRQDVLDMLVSTLGVYVHFQCDDDLLEAFFGVMHKQREEKMPVLYAKHNVPEAIQYSGFIRPNLTSGVGIMGVRDILFRLKQSSEIIVKDGYIGLNDYESLKVYLQERKYLTGSLDGIELSRAAQFVLSRREFDGQTLEDIMEKLHTMKTQEAIQAAVRRDIEGRMSILELDEES